MSAKKCECCVGSCNANNFYNPSYPKDATSEDYFQAMCYYYYCWRNYHNNGYLGGGKNIESDSATCCVTCVEEQRMREERVGRSKNRQTHTTTATSNASNYRTSSSSKFNAHQINTKSDDMVFNDKTTSQDTEGMSDGDDHEEFEMELNNDFKMFLEQSARHKQQRKEEKEAQLVKSQTDDYIEANEIALEATSVAPTQQQGVLRTQEMKMLYGKAAHHIESLETSLQLHFNMNVDMRHPVFWPSIPLKF